MAAKNQSEATPPEINLPEGIPPEPAPEKPFTLAEAAKLVGKSEKQVINFKDYGDWVIVITVDGQKLRAEKNAEA